MFHGSFEIRKLTVYLFGDSINFLALNAFLEETGQINYLRLVLRGSNFLNY
jgi:hypothetical protein